MKTNMKINMNTIVILTCLAMMTGCSNENSGETNADKGGQGETSMSTEQTAIASEIAFNTIEGQPLKLAEFKGQAVLIVNVASKCGYTPQYEGLQALYEKYHERGLTVIGFPANNFGKQEPGSDEEIQEFCSTKFAVTFPMMSKVSVAGDDQHPLFKHLTENSDPAGKISWNFHKFLLDKDGNIIARFDSDVKPLSDELTSKIESLL